MRTGFQLRVGTAIARPPPTYGIIDEAKNCGMPEPWFSRWSENVFLAIDLDRNSGVTGVPIFRAELPIGAS